MTAPSRFGRVAHEQRPLRRVLREDHGISGSTHYLECGHHEPVRDATDKVPKLRRCSTCPLELPGLARTK